MVRISVVVLLALTVLSGCSSTSAFRYYTEPTPLEPGASRYRLQSVEVDLHEGDWAPTSSEYPSESELEDELRQRLREQLATHQVLARGDEDNEAVYDLAVSIDYTRRFKWLIGFSLTSPALGHEVVVSRDDQKLATHRRGGYTTDYGFTGNTLRQLKTLFFLTGPEDERRDIRTLSRALAARVAEFGKREDDS